MGGGDEERVLFCSVLYRCLFIATTEIEQDADADADAALVWGIRLFPVDFTKIGRHAKLLVF